MCHFGENVRPRWRSLSSRGHGDDALSLEDNILDPHCATTCNVSVGEDAIDQASHSPSRLFSVEDRPSTMSTVRVVSSGSPNSIFLGTTTPRAGTLARSPSRLGVLAQCQPLPRPLQCQGQENCTSTTLINRQAQHQGLMRMPLGEISTNKTKFHSNHHIPHPTSYVRHTSAGILASFLS